MKRVLVSFAIYEFGNFFSTEEAEVSETMRDVGKEGGSMQSGRIVCVRYYG